MADADWREKYLESQKRVRKLERGIEDVLRWLHFPEVHMLNAINKRLKDAISKRIGT